jgi:uncharacterized small protein (DUF1192 family)
MQIVSEAPALYTVPDTAEPVGAKAAGAASALPESVRVRRRSPLRRMWRQTARLRGQVGVATDGDLLSGDPLALEVVLLREELARLKAELHRPADLGSVIEHMRRVSAQVTYVQDEDDVWSAFGECLVSREAIAQASSEVEAAIGVLRERLGEGATTTSPMLAAAGRPWAVAPHALPRRAVELGRAVGD